MHYETTVRKHLDQVNTTIPTTTYNNNNNNNNCKKLRSLKRQFKGENSKKNQKGDFEANRRKVNVCLVSAKGHSRVRSLQQCRLL